MIYQKDLNIIFSDLWDELQYLEKMRRETDSIKKMREYKIACKNFCEAVESCKGRVIPFKG